MADKDIQAEFEIVEPELSHPQYEVVDDNGIPKVQILGFDDPLITPQELEGREVAVRKAIVLGTGRININELTAYVEGKIAKVASMDVNTADEADVKKAQAELNKLATELSDNRKSLENEWKNPFDTFIADPIKKLVKLIEAEKKPIADKLTEITTAYQKARLADIGQIKDERLAREDESVDRFIRTLPWFDDAKWLNKGMWGASGKSTTKVAKEIDDKVAQVTADLKAIGMLNADNPFGPQLMEAYRSNGGNLANTLLKKQELEDAAKQYERMQAETKARQEAERIEREKREAEALERRQQAAANAQPVEIGAVDPPKFLHEPVTPRQEPKVEEVAVDLPPVQPVPESEKMYVTTFEVKSTRGDIGRIIAYMNSIGVKSKYIGSKEV